MAAIAINREQFQQRIREERPVLVEFWTPRCSYCRRFAPVYDRVAERYGGLLTVAKVNVDEEPELAEQEQIEVRPTLVLYRKGEAINSVVVPETMDMVERVLRESGIL